jgi:Uma2 family endonuclease
MAAEQRPVFRPITEAEYRIIEADSLEKHEFINGEIYAMAGAKPNHTRLTNAVSASLFSQLRGKPCEVFSSDQRVKVEATGINTYPDVVVACPPLRFDSDDMTLLDAVVIVEVLSPSTAHYDANAKFAHFSQLPSLRHYLLVEQDRVLVEHRRRGESEWGKEFFSERSDRISLEAIGCELTLDELYERTVFNRSV